MKDEQDSGGRRRRDERVTADAPPGGVERTETLERLGTPASVGASDGRNDHPGPKPDADALADLYRTVFEAADDGVLLVDVAADAFLTANPRACDLLGYPDGELVDVSPTTVHADDVARYREFVANALRAGDGWTEELTCTRRDGSTFVAEVAASVVDVRGRTYLLALLRDTTDRRAFERELADRWLAVDAATEGIAQLDVDGEFTYVNGAFAALFGYARDALLGQGWQGLYDEATQERFSNQTQPALFDIGSWRGEAVGVRADGTTFPHELSLTALDDGGVLCIVRDVSERRRRERQLEALSEVSGYLLTAGSTGEIGEIAVAAVEELLGYSLAGVAMYDAETDSLELTALSRELDRVIDPLDPPDSFDVEGTEVGQAYRGGKPTVTLVGEDDPLSQTPITQVLLVPLAEHGILGVGTYGDEGFDRSDVALLEVLAANVAAALGRAGREAELTAARTELAAQRDELLEQRDAQRTLLDVSALAREVVDGVVDARSRADIERVVCERLAASELYHFAWIGEYSADRGRIVPRAGAGVGPSLLDEIADIVVTEGARGAADVAVETGEVQVVRGIGEVDRLHEPVRREALERGFEAAIAVPLSYHGRDYGALVVVAGREDAFDEYELATFEMLGDLVGFTLRAENDRNLLYADSVVEVEVRSTDRSSFFVDAASSLGCRMRFVGIVPTDEGHQKLYALLEGATVDGLAEFATGMPHVRAVEAIDENAVDSLVVVTLSGGSMTYDLTERGAHILDAEVDSTGTRLRFEVPSRDDARSVVEAFLDTYPDTTVVAIREQDRPVRSLSELRGQFLGSLTERQRTCLTSAYLEGYYDWPRRSSAEEVAARLGISSATFHQHVRLAEEKLLRALLD
ncbi:bacterio-opsin activator domain-containing protein [Halobium salinum]|uniref:Bacterio-opsin activator domain-containing protein n=1 Tax=Halobium salinum TaxID=1364940 RepID=A0ABD5PAS0_9EURY|nr:bacterio-opsin activator domain-containing protein [Halobium salinum]